MPFPPMPSPPIIDEAWISIQVVSISAAFRASGLFPASDFLPDGLLASPRTVEHLVAICQNLLEGCYPMQAHHEVVWAVVDGERVFRLAALPVEVGRARVARWRAGVSGTTAVGEERADDAGDETEGEEEEMFVIEDV